PATAPAALNLPGATLEILASVTDPSLRSTVLIVPSTILAEVIALLASMGLGYVPLKSPPAVPPGDAPLIVTLFPPDMVNNPVAGLYVSVWLSVPVLSSITVHAVPLQ